MSQEIVDAIKLLEREKGIDSETLMTALEDALLSAYKKSPGSAKTTSSIVTCSPTRTIA